MWRQVSASSCSPCTRSVVVALDSGAESTYDTRSPLTSVRLCANGASTSEKRMVSVKVMMPDNHAMIQIRKATAAEQSQIRALVIGAGLLPTGLDWRRFFVADENGQIVGCGQIRSHAGGPELSSLVAAKLHRGRGVASSLVRTLIAQQAGPLYLICRAPLRGFYARFGFVEIDDGMPEAVRRKWAVARFFRMPVICMRRSV